MKNTFILLILLLFSCNVFAQLYKNNSLIIIKGQVYKVEVKILKDNADTATEKRLEVDFYPVFSEDTNHIQSSPPVNISHVKKVFVFNQKYKNKKSINLLTALSTGGKGPLANYNKCYVKVRNGVVSLGLNTSNGADRLQVTLPESFAYLATDDGKHSSQLKRNGLPLSHEQTAPEEMDTTGSFEASQATKSFQTYQIYLVGDIDSPKFPQNPRLLRFLKNNNDFVFRLSMDLYLDILRFNADSADYDREKIVNFLSIHDLMYMRYGFNEMKLNKKVTACTKLLQRVNAIYTKGDIFYKDYKMELSRKDVEINPLVLVQNEPQKDENYDAKRVKGESDRFYTENGLNVYLTNWSSLSSPNVRSTEETYMSCLSDNSQSLTLRIYFIVQPYGTYSKKGVFKGVTAYGLKGILFSDCPCNYVCSIDNADAAKPKPGADSLAVQNDSLAIYKDALTYLQKMVRHSGINQSINPKTIYGNGYYPLGDWQQIYQNCEVGYSFWSGNVKRLPGRQALISFKMLTNYQCPLQPGYDLTLLNRNTDARFSVPVSNVSLMTNESSGDYYIVSAKVTTDMLRQMLNAQVNSVACQCLGSVAPSPQTLSRNNVISHGVEKLSAVVDVDEGGTCEKLSSLLKTGF